MQIVIDIPNWLYNAIMEHNEPHYSKSLGEAVRDGMPLPKGHGDLKDMDDIYEALEGWNEDTGWIVDAIDNQAQTIIEADKESGEDCISRQAAVNACLNGWNKDYREIVADLRTLPPVNPQEPKVGHWEWAQYDYNPKFGDWHCSECRCIVLECVDKEEKGGIPLYKYCPQCGCRIQEVEE